MAIDNAQVADWEARQAILQGTIDQLSSRLRASEQAIASYANLLAAASLELDVAAGDKEPTLDEQPVDPVAPDEVDPARVVVTDDLASLDGWLNPYHGSGSYSQQGVRLRENVTVAGGVLTVHARPVTTRTTVGTTVLEPGDYAAGGIMHNTVLTPGVRISLELAMNASSGTRAVALLWPHDMGWPQGGELDFVENGGDIPDRQSTAITNHWAGADGKNAQRVVKFSPHDFTAWTPVEVLWLPGLFVVTVAGRVAAHYLENVPQNPMKLAMQTAVAGGGQSRTWNGVARTPGQLAVRRLRIVRAA